MDIIYKCYNTILIIIMRIGWADVSMVFSEVPGPAKGKEGRGSEFLLTEPQMGHKTAIRSNHTLGNGVNDQ